MKLTKQEKILCWIGAILLLVVAIVHLALSFSLISTYHLLGTLLLLGGIGAIIAMIGVLKNARWIGWVFGILMSGGAAVVKIAILLFPGIAASLLGTPAKQAGGGLATFAIVVEIAYLVVAVYAHFVNQKRLNNK